MKFISVLTLTLLSFSLWSGCSNSSQYDNSRYYEALQELEKMELTVEEKEHQNPVDFLSDEALWRRNLFGEYVIEGKIKNDATIATYKDVVITVYYYSKTETKLGEESFTFYDFLPPGSEKEFKIKSAGYKGTNTIGWKVTNALPAKGR